MTTESESRGVADPVIALAEEYEAATLAALDALAHADMKLQLAACLRFGKAAAALRQMSPEDYGRANNYVSERGRIPDFAWRKIVLAMQNLALE